MHELTDVLAEMEREVAALRAYPELRATLDRLAAQIERARSLAALVVRALEVSRGEAARR